MSPAGWVLSGLVLIYRRVFSPLLGPRCRFEPTCSAYALEAVRRHGAVRGGGLTLWRLARCQPWGTPGLDPVPAPRRARRAGYETVDSWPDTRPETGKPPGAAEVVPLVPARGRTGRPTRARRTRQGARPC